MGKGQEGRIAGQEETMRFYSDVMRGSDPDVRVAYINLQLNAFHTPGT